MPDERSLREKLEAMATQVAESPHEAEIARLQLDRLDAAERSAESAGASLRSFILAQPDRAGSRREVLVRYPSGMRLRMYESEVDWVTIKRYGLSWEYVDA